MEILDALVIISVHGHGHYLTDEQRDMLHEARKATIAHERLIRVKPAFTSAAKQAANPNTRQPD